MSPLRSPCVKLNARKHMHRRAHAFLAAAYASVTKEEVRAPRI